MYDKAGDWHYDIISAYIKSMRGSDPDAALYWLARMLHAGEDPRYIARRLVICASEDVGMADPMALVVAEAAFRAAEHLGMPEARIPLAQATVYVALAPKSNSVYLAIDKALEDVKQKPAYPVPVHLRAQGTAEPENLATVTVTSILTTTLDTTLSRNTFLHSSRESSITSQVNMM